MSKPSDQNIVECNCSDSTSVSKPVESDFEYAWGGGIFILQHKNNL